MYKIKKSYYYLERGFPENLEPAFTDQSTKRKRLLIERKKRILKRSIRKSLRTLVKPFFSAPTKKGVLLEKSEKSFQDLFSPENSLLQSEKHEDLKLGRNLIDTATKTRVHPAGGQISVEPQNFKKNSPFLQSKCKRYKFLFPLYRLKGELSKRESQYGKIELYKKQIQEKKKLAFIYGTMSKNSIKKLVKQARTISSTGNPPTKGRLCASRGLVTLLESRLDVALFRASFFSSIPMARQWINNSKVTVNKKKVRAPSYQLRAGDCIGILPLSALSLKENQRERVAKILPFRRSRKKLVTPSLMRNWCSFESFFPKEKPLSVFYKVKNSPVDLQSDLKHQRDPLACLGKAKTQPETSLAMPKTSLIGNKKILASPTAIENFSLIKNHLQSIWEKSVHSQSFLGSQIGRGNQRFVNQQITSASVESPSLRVRNKNSLPQSIPFSLNLNQESPPLFSQSSSSPPKRRDKRNPEKIYHKKRRKTRTSSTLIHSSLRKGVTLFGRLRRGKLETLDFLNAKQALIQPRNRMQKLGGLQVSAIKPLHLEISYRLLTAIFLYSPQKVAYPGSLDLPLIMRSFK